MPFDPPAGAELRPSLSLRAYIVRRIGVPAGGRGALRNMLHRSLGANSIAGFWRYWNPIFGYVLGRFVFSPLRRVLPRAAALMLTFLVCGAFHDLIATTVRGHVVFIFTCWFFFLGLGLVLSEIFHFKIASDLWAVRALVHLTYVALALLAARWLVRVITTSPLT